MDKQQATFIPQKDDYIVIGHRANIICQSHPRVKLCGRHVSTAPVVAISNDGSFETLNTHYKPVTEV